MNSIDDTQAPKVGRREFLRASGAALGASWLAANLPLVARAAEAAVAARKAEAGFTNLSAEEAADVEAIAARIVPSDDTPGATEAGAVWFVDQALGGFMAEDAPEFRDGLAELNALVSGRTGTARFALLDVSAQDDVLRARENSEFFGTMRFLTLAGLLTMPTYGGNRDMVGWKLIGFEHRHVWAPPFGYYDAEAAEEAGDHV